MVTNNQHHPPKKLKLIRKADAVVLTSFPIGKGQRKKLGCSKLRLKQTNPHLHHSEEPIEKRDHTQGEATKKLTQLKNKGAKVIEHEAALFPALKTLSTKTQIAGKDQFAVERFDIPR
jgi:hypothetical protein